MLEHTTHQLSALFETFSVQTQTTFEDAADEERIILLGLVHLGRVLCSDLEEITEELKEIEDDGLRCERAAKTPTGKEG
jgi:hypothetical protein